MRQAYVTAALPALGHRGITKPLLKPLSLMKLFLSIFTFITHQIVMYILYMTFYCPNFDLQIDLTNYKDLPKLYKLWHKENYTMNVLSRMPAETPELLINLYTSLLLFAILHKHVQTFYIYPSFATA